MHKTFPPVAYLFAFLNISLAVWLGFVLFKVYQSEIVWAIYWNVNKILLVIAILTVVNAIVAIYIGFRKFRQRENIIKSVSWWACLCLQVFLGGFGLFVNSISFIFN